MAIQCRNDVSELVLALVAAHNAMQSVVQTDGYNQNTTPYHQDLTQTNAIPILDAKNVVLTTVTVAAAAATNLATTLTLANQVLAVLGNMHMPDGQVHVKADTVNNPILNGYTPASTLATAEVLLNALSVLFVAHLTASGVHVHNDGTSYSGLSTPATDLTSSQNLANSLKAAVNTHMANVGGIPACPRIRVIGC